MSRPGIAWVTDITYPIAAACGIFVAVMGAADYTYAEAIWSQKLPDRIGPHIRAVQHHGRRATIATSRLPMEPMT